jgi:hypothetical protein
MQRGLILAFSIALLPANASAVINKAVENACQSEYLTYCFGMAIPSEQLRACFRGHMMQLGSVCLKALVDNNEATKADVERYLVATRKAK